MTIDKSRPPHLPGTLPSFTPVPRQCQRHDGWTPKRQRQFIEVLAATGSVKSAAQAVSMASEGAYALRRHPKAAEFREAWEAALALGVQRLEDVAMARALEGVEVPVYSYGKLIGKRTVHNDRLLMFLLRNRAPGRFAGERAGALSALDRQALARHKQEWRQQWEAERLQAEREADRADDDGLLEQLKRMHRNWYCTMSPKTRAAYRTFRESEDADMNGSWRNDPHRETIADLGAEYEQHFGEGRDRRAHIKKLVDMRYWRQHEEEGEGGEV